MLRYAEERAAPAFILDMTYPSGRRDEQRLRPHRFPLSLKKHPVEVASALNQRVSMETSLKQNFNICITKYRHTETGACISL